MMGTVEFASACFYRYAVVDCAKLLSNLKGDQALAEQSLHAFLNAAVAALPTGRQNTFAAHNPPAFVLAVARRAGAPWSLAGAYEQPVWSPRGGLVGESIRRLDLYWGRLLRMYGPLEGTTAWGMLDESLELKYLQAPCSAVAEVIERAMQAVHWDGGEEES
jgi:CRISPR system Cascade subunit CasC